MTQRLLAALVTVVALLAARTVGAEARFLQFGEETPAQHLTTPVATVVSADGAFVYVAAFSDATITTFARDAGDGTLLFVGDARNGVGGVTGLSSLRALALSPDGAHLYASGGDTVVVFSRDGIGGELTWVETEQNGMGGVTNLYGAQDVAVSPDGAHVYVVAQGYPSAVLIFSRNAGTGELTFVQAVVDGAPDGLTGAFALVLSADGAHVYVVSSYDDTVAAFSRNALTGALTLVETELVDGPLAVAMSADGAHVYVTSYPNRLSVYSRNAGTGALAFEQVWVDGVGGVTAMDYPTDVEVTPDGAHVYVTADSYSDQALVVFSRDGGTGELSFVQEYRNNAGGITGLTNPNGIVASPDGANLYVTAGYNYYYPSAVTTFSRNAGTGSVAQLQALSSSIAPYALALTSDGAHVYGAEGNGISVYSRDGGTGILTRESALAVTDGTGGVDGIAAVSHLAVSPDGAHLYAVGQADNALAAFARNSSTGALTFIEVERDGVGGVDGLYNPQDLAMSADGAHLYVAGYYDDAVAVFTRNTGTGSVAQTQVVKHGVGGVTGLNAPDGLALAPDGAHLYVLAYEAVTTFARDGGTGALSFLRTASYTNFNPNGVTVSPDGAFVYLYATYYYYGGATDIMRVFRRDPATGVLTLAGRIKSNEGGLAFSTYYGDAPLVFRNDGAAAYWRGSIFARNPETGLLGFLGTIDGYNVGAAAAVGPLDELYGSSGRSVRRYAPGYAGCDGGPLPVCRATTGGIVTVSALANYVVWSWFAASPVDPGDFGAPHTTDHYSLCIWDESGPTPELVLRSMAPAAQQCSATRPCWSPTASGFTYRDRARSPEGITSLILKSGPAGVASVKLTARKGGLRVPGLPLGVPVRVQLQTSAGECFEGVYSSPGVNNGAAFSSRAD